MSLLLAAKLSNWGKSRELHFLVLYILLQPAVGFRVTNSTAEEHKYALENTERKGNFSWNNKLGKLYSNPTFYFLC